MAKFSYTATRADGSIVHGKLNAVDRPGAIATLTGQNLSPLSLDEASKGGFSIPLLNRNKVKTDDVVMFTRQMSAMVSAGVPLTRALASQQSHTDSAALKSILNTVLKDVQSGMQFADALAKHPKAFDDIYVNMVRAGEAGGILDDILKRLAIQEEKSSGMKKKVKGAMVYPLVLLCITAIAFFILMIFVIPQIGKTIKDLGGEDAQLPALTQIMLGISDFLVTKGIILVPVVIILVYFARKFFKTSRGKHIANRIMLKVPAIKNIIQKVAVAQFARTFSALLGSGANVVSSLEITSHAVGNIVYEEAIADAAKQVQAGKNLSEIIENTGLFPSIVSQMLAVGEETGQTDAVLIKVADFYDEEVDVAISSISSIIEPVMIVLMGGMVGLIAVSVMMPIAGLASNVKG